MSNKGINLNNTQIAELRELFQKFDENNDGKLTQLDLSSLLQSIEPSEKQLKTLIQAADKNNNKLIEFSEFISLVSLILIAEKLPYNEGQLKQLFKMFDRDDNRLITAAELAHSMAKLGRGLSSEEIDGMIKEVGDGDGCISFQEFCEVISLVAFDNFWS